MFLIRNNTANFLIPGSDYNFTDTKCRISQVFGVKSHLRHLGLVFINLISLINLIIIHSVFALSILPSPLNPTLLSYVYVYACNPAEIHLIESGSSQKFTEM